MVHGSWFTVTYGSWFMIHCEGLNNNGREESDDGLKNQIAGY